MTIHHGRLAPAKQKEASTMSITPADTAKVEDDAGCKAAKSDQWGRVAGMLRGRLRNSNIPSRVLKDLKHELLSFNARTGAWKD